MVRTLLKSLKSDYGQFRLDRKEKMCVYHVETPQLLIQASGHIKHQCCTQKEKAVFFRGQTRLYNGALKPSLYRDVKKENQVHSRDEALNKYLNSFNTDVDVLRKVDKDVREPLLQHYGVRTRWIDVVDNIWIALWFACHKARTTGRHGEYLHFVPRGGHDERYAYIVLVETDWKQDSNRPGFYIGETTECVDLRMAAPSTFVRPHSQHALLARIRPTERCRPFDFAMLNAGVIRVKVEDALEWIGGGKLLSPHVLFPSPFYDFGYRDLLGNAPEPCSIAGTINHVGA